MKRLACLTWWHDLPHKSTRAVNAAETRAQPWTTLALRSTNHVAAAGGPAPWESWSPRRQPR